MTKLLKIAIIPCLFILLIGCTNNKDQQSAPPPSNSASNDSNSHSTDNSNESDVPLEELGDKPSDGTADNPSTTNTGQAVESEQVKLIQEIVELAKKGTVKNSIFPVESTMIDQITAKWGEPDQLDYVAGNRYATYSSREFVFGINKGEQIFDVRSYAKELQQITFDQVKKELGTPDDIRTSSGDTIWVYNVTDKYQLKFVGSNANIDHISVIYPAASRNNMAG